MLLPFLNRFEPSLDTTHPGSIPEANITLGLPPWLRLSSPSFRRMLLTTPRLILGSPTGQVGADGCYVAWPGLGNGQGATRSPPDHQVDGAMVVCRE